MSDAAFVAWNQNRKNTPGWIVDASGCHIWQGARSGPGYGVVTIGGKNAYIHRVRYEREVGPIPVGAQLDHFVCDNGAGGCCNPLHCRPVSSRENTLRGNAVSAACAAKTHCPKGHPLSGDNLDNYHRMRGMRKCRICANARDRAKRAAKARQR